MQITRDKAQIWVYTPTPTDEPMKGIFNGWLYRPGAYLHHKCSGYFTHEEEHKCAHWSKEFQAQQEKHCKRSQKSVAVKKKSKKCKSHEYK